jgi:hypothetical protein
VPAYHSGTARVVPHSSSPALIAKYAPFMQAALQGGLHDVLPRDDDQPKTATSPPVIGNGTSPPFDQKRGLTAE